MIEVGKVMPAEALYIDILLPRRASSVLRGRRDRPPNAPAIELNDENGEHPCFYTACRAGRTTAIASIIRASRRHRKDPGDKHAVRIDHAPQAAVMALPAGVAVQRGLCRKTSQGGARTPGDFGSARRQSRFLDRRFGFAKP
jgi:hypothetical protein